MTTAVLCIGATLIDELHFCDQAIVASSSNPAHKSTSIGGVVSNIAQHLALLDVNVNCITALGKDNEGILIQQEYQKMKIGLKDSPVNDDSSTRRPCVSNNLKSAGTTFPASIITISPGTNTVDDIITRFLLRKTVA
jgi:sugar/nucleoside kinase (ribokinase family)